MWYRVTTGAVVEQTAFVAAVMNASSAFTIYRRQHRALFPARLGLNPYIVNPAIFSAEQQPANLSTTNTVCRSDCHDNRMLSVWELTQK